MLLQVILADPGLKGFGAMLPSAVGLASPAERAATETCCGHSACSVLRLIATVLFFLCCIPEMGAAQSAESKERLRGFVGMSEMRVKRTGPR